jgi:hypothetical protein
MFKTAEKKDMPFGFGEAPPADNRPTFFDVETRQMFSSEVKIIVLESTR